MWEAKVSEKWDHTAAIAAYIVNSNKQKGRGVKPDQLHPFRKGKSGLPLTKENIGVLRAFVPDGKTSYWTYENKTGRFARTTAEAADRREDRRPDQPGAVPSRRAGQLRRTPRRRVRD